MIEKYGKSEILEKNSVENLVITYNSQRGAAQKFRGVDTTRYG